MKLNYFGKEKRVAIIGKTVNYISTRKWTDGQCNCRATDVIDQVVDNNMGISLYSHGNNVGFIRYFHISV